LRNNLYTSLFTFFGLRENPFTNSPNPRYLFVTRQIQETLDAVADGIEKRKGMTLLTGEVGTGKTTVINRLLYWLQEQHRPAAFICSSIPEPSHLFDFISADFGVPFDTQAKGSGLAHLNQWLLDRYCAGEIPVLIVDEAQGLPINVLEAIRMLLDLETQQHKLLQIVLSGHPELDEKLRQPEQRQLKQRITVRCKTEALTLQETHDYIQSRLNIAGASGRPMFEFQAMNTVYRCSRGVPRVVNLLCEHALINAYADEVHLVPAHIVEGIAHEFQFDNESLVLSMDLRSAETTDTMNKQSVIPAAPLSFQNVGPQSPEVKTNHRFGEVWCRLSARIFAKGASQRLGIDSAPRVQSSTHRVSVPVLHPVFEYLQSLRQKAEHAFHRTKALLIPWLQQPLIHRHPLISGVQNPPGAIVWSIIAMLRQLLRLWHWCRNFCLPVVERTNRHRLTAFLLRWLQQPYRPFLLRPPNPKETNRRSRVSSAS
jgi:type II secretory pathway predicted ATPase ExeA